MATKLKEAESATLNSLYIQALRQGQSIWFRVVSGSMHPLLRVEDAVHIQPASLSDLHIGDIAAFETPAGLVVHRIVHVLPSVIPARFIEMGDITLQAHEVTEEAIAGRVCAVRRGDLLIDLQRPVAKRLGGVTARMRYRLYCKYRDSKHDLVRLVVRKSARLAARVGSAVIRRACASLERESSPLDENA